MKSLRSHSKLHQVASRTSNPARGPMSRQTALRETTNTLMNSLSSQLRLTQHEMRQRLNKVKFQQQFLTTSKGVLAARRVTLLFLYQAVLHEIPKMQCKTHSLMGECQVSPWQRSRVPLMLLAITMKIKKSIMMSTLSRRGFQRLKPLNRPSSNRQHPHGTEITFPWTNSSQTKIPNRSDSIKSSRL